MSALSQPGAASGDPVTSGSAVGDSAQAGFAAGDPALPGVAQADAALMTRLLAALRAKGATYEPRTRHLNADGSPKYTNRLILESSPYLLQHAHNPVNWYAWGDEAFARAKRENKPVLLSVGYSTCHWCHVMERESFEDEEIARFLNEHFVPIKVDREERPDIDDVYMQAVQVMTGGGGWPMTLMLTPDREPFFGGTYFPPRDGVRGAQQGFLSILRELSAVYERDPPTVVKRAGQLSTRLREAARSQPAPGIPRGEAIHVAARQLARGFDPEWGGFGTAPKFPQPSTHELLLRYFRRTNDPQALRIVALSLEKMAAGGMYDQVGGGFHRYSTDRTWLVPHFEKMLYDNAQLTCLYLDAYQVLRRDDLARIARETLDYVAREMTSPEGGFYSATDADSETPQGHEEEGWFFTWTAAEIDQVLGPERARLVREHYGVSDAGNFEGRNILRVARPLDEVAASLAIKTEDAARQLQEARKLLYDARSKRRPPLRDDKILASWNALMISAFARGGFVLDRSDYIDRARTAAEFVLTRMRDPQGRLHRSFKDTLGAQLGYLDDYAFTIQSLLDLYEATWEPRWLETAIDLQRRIDDGYYDDEAGGYFMTSGEHETLLVRQKPSFDWAEPSGNSVAAMNLLRLSEFTEREEFRARAENVFKAFATTLQATSAIAPKMLSALDFYLDEPLEVVVVNAPDDAQTATDLLTIARAFYFPNRIFSVMRSAADADRQVRLIPLLEGKRPLGGRTTAYVCKKGVCKRPTSDAQQFAQQLITVEPLWKEGDLPALPIVGAQRPAQP